MQIWMLTTMVAGLRPRFLAKDVPGTPEARVMVEEIGRAAAPHTQHALPRVEGRVHNEVTARAAHAKLEAHAALEARIEVTHSEARSQAQPALEAWPPVGPAWPVVALAAFAVGLASSANALRRPVVVVADELGVLPLCGLQALGCLASLLLGDRVLPATVPLVLVADTVAHTALLLRVLIAFLLARHAHAARAVRRKLAIWSVWLDARAHLPTVVACVAWVTSALSTLLFAVVAMTGWSLWPWARWGFNALLGCLVLVLAALTAPEHRHRAAPPTAVVGAALLAGLAHGGSRAGGLGALPPALLLLDALRGWLLANGSAAPARYGPPDYVDRQLQATLAGNQDTDDFESFLGCERRGCAFYCFQDLVLAEADSECMQEKFRAAVAAFVARDAPFPVALDQPEAVVCVPAAVHKMKQALLVQLRPPYVRFLADKRQALTPPKRGKAPVLCKYMHGPAIV